MASHRKDLRRERLGSALRENLKRRKAQARSRAEGVSEPSASTQSQERGSPLSEAEAKPDFRRNTLKP